MFASSSEGFIFSFSRHFSSVSTECVESKFKGRRDPETVWNWYEFESRSSNIDKKMVSDDTITFPNYQICILQARNQFR